jgi:hypothetical protein
MNLTDAVALLDRTNLPARDAMHIAHIRIVMDKK